MHLNPPNWIEPITEACEPGRVVLLHHRHRPGFANDLFPMTLMGRCSEVRKVRASELLDYTNYTGDYEFEMESASRPSIGRSRKHRHPGVSPGAERSDDRLMAAGHHARRDHHHGDKWVTPTERKSAKGIIAPGKRCGRAVHDQRQVPGRDPHPARTRQPDRDDAAPEWPTGNETTSLASTSRAHRASSRRRRFGSPTARGATRRPPDAWRPACARSTL